MARRGRKSGRFARHSYRRGRSGKSGGSLGGMTSLISAALYGSVRSKIAKASAPMVEKLPFQNYNHEVVFGGLATLLPMIFKQKGVAAALKPVQLIEIASAAEETVQRFNAGEGAASSDAGVYG